MMHVAERTLHISGGTPLSGEFTINTAKNSALVLMLSALLTREKVILEDIPRLSDVLIMVDMLRHFGAEVDWHGRNLHIQAREITSCDAPYHLVSKMRASFVALGPLLARCRAASVSMPGGCAFGPRPVDRHIKAFKQLGATVIEGDGDFEIRRDQRLEGRVVFEAPTVGGTENVMLASALAAGEVTIENAALEPEISDLANMLIAMGADIEGAGTSTIIIRGVNELRGVTYRPIPDRIEAGTFMLAVAATRGEVTFKGLEVSHVEAVVQKLREAGVYIEALDNHTLYINAKAGLRPVDIEAVVYPGFPTDLQAPFGAFLATVSGRSTVIDTVYNGRYTHIEELVKAGLRFELDDNTLHLTGGTLHGANMHAADIRAGGALIVAALAAKGKSVISGLEYIERGYEAVAERLRRIGANMHVISETQVATGTFGD